MRSYVRPRTTNFGEVIHVVSDAFYTGSATSPSQGGGAPVFWKFLGTLPIQRVGDPSVQKIFGTFYLRSRSLRNSNQILHVDQTIYDKMFTGLSTPCPSRNFRWYEYWPFCQKMILSVTRARGIIHPAFSFFRASLPALSAQNWNRETWASPIATTRLSYL